MQALATELEPEAQEALAALTRGPQRRRQLMARLRAVAQEVAQDLQVCCWGGLGGCAAAQEVGD